MKQLLLKRESGIFILLVLLCTVVAILNPHFLRPQNLQNEGRLIGMFGIFSIGAGIVIMTGGIDLSIGSLIALLGVQLAIILVEKHYPWPLAILVVMVTACLLGLFHGLLITGLRLQPFIVTLCSLLMFRGSGMTIAHDETKGLGVNTGFEFLQNLTTGEIFGVPNQFVLLVVIAIIMWVLLHRSVYGRYLFAVGQNEAAARYSGIRTRRIIISAYVLCSLFGAISGILLAFYSVSISPSTHAQSYELYGIAAAVLGGCSLNGGEGSIIGIVLGTTLLQVLQNLVILLNIPSSLNFAVMGAVILVGVIADQLLRKK